MEKKDDLKPEEDIKIKGNSFKLTLKEVLKLKPNLKKKKTS